jgi:hypothetical protein
MLENRVNAYRHAVLKNSGLCYGRSSVFIRGLYGYSAEIPKNYNGRRITPILGGNSGARSVQLILGHYTSITVLKTNILL